VHDIYDEDREAEWWWDARRPLYVRLYRAAALQSCGTYISVPACWEDEQDACEREGRAAMMEATSSCDSGEGCSAGGSRRRDQRMVG